MPIVTSDEALSLLRRVASGHAIPGLKDASQLWTDETVNMIAEGWQMEIFTDDTRSRHIESVTSPDGRRGVSSDWCSDVEYSQQPEDRLNREDGDAVDRMFQAFKRARVIESSPFRLPATEPNANR